MNRIPYTLSLLVIGSANVGKYSISNRFCKGNFIPWLLHTVGIDYRIRSIDLLTHKLKITIWDTAGQDKVKVLPATTIRKAEGILYVFDVNNQITV